MHPYYVCPYYEFCQHFQTNTQCTQFPLPTIDNRTTEIVIFVISVFLPGSCHSPEHKCFMLQFAHTGDAAVFFRGV